MSPAFATIDIPTLALSRGLIQLVLAGLLWFLRRLDAAQPLPLAWPLGFLLSGAALLTFPVQAPAYQTAMNVVNHLAAGVSAAALLAGFWQFNGDPVRRAPLLLIVALPVAGLVLGQWLRPDPVIRLACSACAQLICYLLLFTLLAHPFREEVRPLYRGLRVLLGAYLLVFGWQYALILAPLAGVEPPPAGAAGYRPLFSVASLLFMVALAVACIALQCVRIAAQHADSAATDWLTGLLNRRGLALFARQNDARHARGGFCSAVICMDLDHFKTVNDRFGHATGDTVLRSLAEIIRRNVRAEDVVARQGGEEFAVLLSDNTEAQAIEVAERIRIDFLAVQHPAPRGERFQVSLSAGVAEVGGEGGTENALEQADAALYMAKAAGRNRVVGASSLAPDGAGQAAATLPGHPAPALAT